MLNYVIIFRGISIMFTKENLKKLSFKKKIVITSLLIFLISMSLLTGFTFKMVSSKFKIKLEKMG